MAIFPLINFIFFSIFHFSHSCVQVVPPNQNAASFQSPTHTPLPQTSAQVCGCHIVVRWCRKNVSVALALNMQLLANKLSSYAHFNVGWSQLSSSGCLLPMFDVSANIWHLQRHGNRKVLLFLISLITLSNVTSQTSSIFFLVDFAACFCWFLNCFFFSMQAELFSFSVFCLWLTLHATCARHHRVWLCLCLYFDITTRPLWSSVCVNIPYLGKFCDLSPSPSLEHLFLLYQVAQLGLVQV